MADGSTGAITIDVPGWKRQVEWLAREYGVSARFIMYEVHRLFCMGIQRKLPAAKKGGGKVLGGMPFADYIPTLETFNENYKGPIDADLARIFVPITSAMQISDQMKQQGFEHARILRTKGDAGAAWLVDSNLYDPNGAGMEEHHRRNRGQNGRVTRAGTRDRRIGRWKQIDKLHVKQSAYRRYVRQVKSHVGKTKSGMNAGVMMASDLARQPAKISTWISRHGTQHGSATNAMAADGSGFLEARNHIPWSGRFEGIARAEARIRTRDLHTHFEKRMEPLAQRWSTMRTA